MTILRAAIAGLAATVALLASTVPTPTAAQAPAGQKHVWKMQSTWPVSAMVHFSPVELVKMIDEMSGGRLKIQLSPAGTYVPAFEVLDAVHKGVIDAAHSWPGYWTGKNTAAGLFGPPPTGPFGLGRDEFISWMLAGGGEQLYNEMLQKELKLNVMMFTTTTNSYWEAFGWMRKPFENLADIRKLKFRTSGLGLEMMRNMGVPAVQMPGGEVIPALERGAIDGAEWGTPAHDITMGFHNVTKFYYMPDLRQPPAMHEFLISTKKWAELSPDLQAIVKWASQAEITRMTAYSVNEDSIAAEELKVKHGVKIMRTPPDVLKAQLEATEKLLDAESKKNPFFAKVLESQRAFAKRAVPHAEGIRPPLEDAVKHYWAQK